MFLGEYKAAKYMIVANIITMKRFVCNNIMASAITKLAMNGLYTSLRILNLYPFRFIIWYHNMKQVNSVSTVI